MLLNFCDKTFDVFFLGYIRWNPNGLSGKILAAGEFIETANGLVDALLTAGLARANEECLGAGEEERSGCV